MHAQQKYKRRGSTLAPFLKLKITANYTPQRAQNLCQKFKTVQLCGCLTILLLSISLSFSLSLSLSVCVCVCVCVSVSVSMSLCLSQLDSFHTRQRFDTAIASFLHTTHTHTRKERNLCLLPPTVIRHIGLSASTHIHTTHPYTNTHNSPVWKRIWS